MRATRAVANEIFLKSLAGLYDRDTDRAIVPGRLENHDSENKNDHDRDDML